MPRARTLTASLGTGPRAWTTEHSGHPRSFQPSTTPLNPPNEWWIWRWTCRVDPECSRQASSNDCTETCALVASTPRTRHWYTRLSARPRSELAWASSLAGANSHDLLKRRGIRRFSTHHLATRWTEGTRGRATVATVL